MGLKEWRERKGFERLERLAVEQLAEAEAAVAAMRPRLHSGGDMWIPDGDRLLYALSGLPHLREAAKAAREHDHSAYRAQFAHLEYMFEEAERGTPFGAWDERHDVACPVPGCRYRALRGGGEPAPLPASAAPPSRAPTAQKEHRYSKIILGKARDFVVMHHQGNINGKEALKAELGRPWRLQMAMESLAPAAWEVVVKASSPEKAVQILDQIVHRLGDQDEIRLAASGIVKVLDLAAPEWFQLSTKSWSEAQTSSGFGLWMATEGLAALTDLALDSLSDHDEEKWEYMLADLTERAISRLPRPGA